MWEPNRPAATLLIALVCPPPPSLTASSNPRGPCFLRPFPPIPPSAPSCRTHTDPTSVPKLYLAFPPTSRYGSRPHRGPAHPDASRQRPSGNSNRAASSASVSDS
ncbi:hypothetical protein BST61_g5898 [Cercospora zeina]